MGMTNWITENRVFWILSMLLIAATAVDIYTAISSPIFEIAEANPIFLFTGSMTFLTIINIGITYWIIKSLKNTISLQKIFFIVMITLYLSLGHLIGASSNILATDNYEANPEEFIAQHERITTTQKTMSYFALVGLFMIIPMVFAYISFLVAFMFF